MLVALIAPIKNLDMIAGNKIHMALTHLVLTNEQYRNFYANEKGYKILDNSAFEDSLQSIDKVLKAAEMIKADEIILPDIIYDSAQTLISTRAAIKHIRDLGVIGKYQLMAVVQGDSEQEWWNCYDELTSINEINVIGLSKLSCPKAFNKSISESRIDITWKIKRSKRKINKQIHLLGGSYQILDEVKRHAEFVRSIDSSAPFEFGKNRISLKTAKSDLPTKANLDQEVRSYNKNYVKTNIKNLLKAAGEENDNRS